MSYQEYTTYFKEYYFSNNISYDKTFDQLFNEFDESFNKSNDSCNVPFDLEHRKNLVKDIFNNLNHEMSNIKIGDIIIDINNTETWGTIVKVEVDKSIGYLNTGRIVKFCNFNKTWKKIFVEIKVDINDNENYDIFIGRSVRSLKTKKFIGKIVKVIDDDETIYMLDTFRTIEKTEVKHYDYDNNENKKWYIDPQKNFVKNKCYGGFSISKYGVDQLCKFYNRFKPDNVPDITFSDSDYDLKENDHLVDLVREDKQGLLNGSSAELGIASIPYEYYKRGFYTRGEYDGIENYNVDYSSVREWEKNQELEKKIQKLEYEKRILRNEIDRFITYNKIQKK